MVDYKFTKDWFSQHIDLWKQLIPLLPARKAFLEIGCYEGRATVWIMENMLERDGVVVCVDPWQPTDVHPGNEEANAEARFDHNVCEATQIGTSKSVVKFKMPSYNLLAIEASRYAAYYDFIYIDGDHSGKAAMTDACMAWPLLKVGGIMVFDDYNWGAARDLLHRPKLAVDMFATLFSEELNILHMGYQYVVQKITPASA